MTAANITRKSGAEKASAEFSPENGSKETMTDERFATANRTRLAPSGTRMTQNRSLRMRDPVTAGSAARNVQAVAHFLAGLEIRHDLFGNLHLCAGARVAADARGARCHRKRTEAAELDAIAARERDRDFIENGLDDVLDVALIQVRVGLG